MHHMINLLCCFRKHDPPIRLNAEFHLDLQRWLQFSSSWNRVAFWLFLGIAATPDLQVTSTASGSLAFGAYFRGEWFTGSWTTSQASQSIAYKELFPVVIAAHLWGPQWARCHILFCSDSEPVVHILNFRTSKIPGLMCLFCHLLASAVSFHFFFSSQHVPGIHNSVVNALFGIDQPSLEQQCQFFLVQGFVASTRRSYSSGQRNFINFCAQMGKLHPNGSPCMTDEWTLCPFASFLVRSVKHSLIKVYLSAVPSLQIEEGFSDSLVNCLCLQQVVQGTKFTQGSSQVQRLPITDNILINIFNSLAL